MMRGPSLPVNVRVAQHVAPGFDEVPGLVSELFENIRQRLNPAGFEGIALIGDALQRFEAIHPFVDGNGRTGRQLANHLMTLLTRGALIVFRAAERPEFYAAHSSRKAMRRFIVEKSREAWRPGDGQVWERKARYDSADRYASPDGTGSILLECHELLEAERSWR